MDWHCLSRRSLHPDRQDSRQLIRFAGRLHEASDRSHVPVVHDGICLDRDLAELQFACPVQSHQQFRLHHAIPASRRE